MSSRIFAFLPASCSARVRLHYTTLGAPARDETASITNAVLLLHGEGETGAGFLSAAVCRLDVRAWAARFDPQRYYVIFCRIASERADSSKASDGLLGHFPRYTYDDMVGAQYRLVLNKLGVNHLRLIIGSAMGGAQTLLWGQAHPYFVDTLLALNCLPAPIAASSDAQRRALVEAAADERVDAMVRQQLAKTAALDLSYQLDAARTYDPKTRSSKRFMPSWSSSTSPMIRSSLRN